MFWVLNLSRKGLRPVTSISISKSRESLEELKYAYCTGWRDVAVHRGAGDKGESDGDD